MKRRSFLRNGTLAAAGLALIPFSLKGKWEGDTSLRSYALGGKSMQVRHGILDLPQSGSNCRELPLSWLHDLRHNQLFANGFEAGRGDMELLSLSLGQKERFSVQIEGMAKGFRMYKEGLVSGKWGEKVNFHHQEERYSICLRKLSGKQESLSLDPSEEHCVYVLKGDTLQPQSFKSGEGFVLKKGKEIQFSAQGELVYLVLSKKA